MEAAADVWSRPGFDTFLSRPRLGFEPFDYQLQTAQTVLRRMRGRAILADEVGLGKTIEAGLVLSELVMRGLVRSVLVLVPPSLIEQWQGEMRRKFSLELVSHDDPSFREQGQGVYTLTIRAFGGKAK